MQKSFCISIGQNRNEFNKLLVSIILRFYNSVKHLHAIYVLLLFRHSMASFWLWNIFQHTYKKHLPSEDTLWDGVMYFVIIYPVLQLFVTASNVKRFSN